VNIQRALRATLIAVLICCAKDSFPEGDSNYLKVTTEGSSSGPVIESQAQAIERAKDAIIYKILGPYAPTGDFKPFKKLIEQSHKYIYSTRVLESKREENATHVKIESHVIYRQLISDIAAIVAPKLVDPLRCLILVAETIEDQLPDLSKPSYAEFALAEVLHHAKIEVADTKVVRSRYTAEELLAQIKGGDDVPTFNIDDGSDVAIVGDCTVSFENSAPKSNIVEATATVTLRIYELQNFALGQVYSGEASVKGATKSDTARQAVQDACARIGNDVFSAAILASASRPQAKGSQMQIRGLNDESQFNAVVESVRKFPGVKDVTPIHWSRLVSRLNFDYSGAGDRLAEFISNSPFPGFKLRSHMVLGNALEFEVE
jgi:hypothetical protein